MRQRKGFTLIELLVVIAIIALLISILLPSLASVREWARRIKCLKNVESIGKGISLYTGEASSNGSWPWLFGNTPTPGLTINNWRTTTTGTNRLTEPFWSNTTLPGFPGAPDARAVTAQMFMILRGEYVESRHFICPSTDDQSQTVVTHPDPNGRTVYDWDFSGPGDPNWDNQRHVSYAYTAPIAITVFTRAGLPGVSHDTEHPDQVAAVGDKSPISEGRNPTLPNWADPNLTPQQMKDGMSPNHKGLAINLLFGDFHASVKPRADVGYMNGNVYSCSGRGFDPSGNDPNQTRVEEQGPGLQDLLQHKNESDSFIIGPF